MNTTVPKLRGFAAIAARDPERAREIARLGGAAVPHHKRSFSQDRALAAEAGRVGGRNGTRGPKRTDPAA